MNKTNQEFKHYATGALLSPVDVRDYRLAKVSQATELPEEFELKMPAVKNQDTISSCVAHSIATTVEYFNIKQHDDATKMSTNYIYGNRIGHDHDGPGMYIKKAVASTCKYGDVTLKDFPGNTEVPEVIEMFNKKKDKLYDKGLLSRFSYYYSVKSQREIKTSLMENGPVIFSIRWYDDMKIEDGILKTDKQGDAGCHCMVIYGWNKDGWLFQNSWGTSFGKNGRAVLPYDIKILEAYSIVDNIIAGVEVKKPYSSKIGRFFAKIINWFLNLFKKN